MQSGTGVCNFSVAVTEKWKDRQTNENKESTTWYRVAVWGNQAESCNTYLQKGSQVMIVGTVSARGYLDKSGEAKASLDLKAQNVRFLSNGNNAGGDGQSQPKQPTSNTAPQTNEDIPF
jgi:single-strand DNA-binding protein